MHRIEIWRPVKGYEGLYEVSNFGRVRSLDRVVSFVNKGKQINRFFKGGTVSNVLCSEGYYFNNLSKNGILEQKRTHRLVAEAFIPNPDNLPCVNHKDRNRLNNCVDNLEWCSYQYNNTYDDVHKERGLSERNRADVSKKVRAINIETGEEKTFPSTQEAGRFLGNVNKAGNIRHAIKNNRAAYGYKWKYD